MIFSFKRRFHKLSIFFFIQILQCILFTNDLSFTFDINLTIHNQTLKQCALYTIMNIKPRVFFMWKILFYRNIVDNLEEIKIKTSLQ
jgi:hypothetical protein